MVDFRLAMPIYEYDCRACGHGFEELVLGSETPLCPSCEGTNLEKRQSTFGVSGGRAGSTPVTLPPPSGSGSCGTCGDPGGPGSCST